MIDSVNLYRIQNSTGAGLYANYLAVLGACDLIDRRGGHVNVDFRQGYYLDPSRGPNWWDYYYRQPPTSMAEYSDGRSMFDKIDLGESTWPTWLQFNLHAAKMSRPRAKYLIEKYIHPSQAAVGAVEDFMDSVMWNKLNFTIGVHIRKTNKTDEGAPMLDNEFVAKEISRAYEIYGDGRRGKIFVATDDAKTAEYLDRRFPRYVVKQDALRSVNRYALYNASNSATLNPDAYRLGMEAVVDTHMLASCDVLLATDSMMSIVAGHMGGDKPIINMTSRYKCVECVERPFADHLAYVYDRHKPHPALEAICQP